MFEISMSFAQAVEWAKSKGQAVEDEKRGTERKLAECRMWLEYGPPIKDRAQDIAHFQKRIPKLGKAIKNWLKVAAIWALGKKAELKVSFSGGGAPVALWRASSCRPS